MEKVIINMELRPRFGDVKKAAVELGVDARRFGCISAGLRPLSGAKRPSALSSGSIFRKGTKK